MPLVLLKPSSLRGVSYTGENNGRAPPPLLNARSQSRSDRAPLSRSVRDAHSHARTLRPSATHGRVDISDTLSGSRVLAAARRFIHNVRNDLASEPVFRDIAVEVLYFLFFGRQIGCDGHR